MPFDYKTITELGLDRAKTARALSECAARHQAKHKKYREAMQAIEDDERLVDDYKRERQGELRAAWLKERKTDADELVSYINLIKAFDDAPADLDRLSRAVGIIAAAGEGCPSSVLNQLAEAAKGSPAELRAMNAAARSSMGDNSMRASTAIARFLVPDELFTDAERIVRGSASDGTDAALLGTGELAICDQLARAVEAVADGGVSPTLNQVTGLSND